MIRGRFRGAAFAWLLLLAYASLYPFVPLRLPSADMMSAALARPKYLTTFDTVVNVLAYIPLGVVAALHFRQRWAPAAAIARAVAFGAAFSATMEMMQLFIPGRVCSIYDTFANTFGTFVGALAFADPVYSMLTVPLGRKRQELVIGGEWGDAGLVMILLWLIAQLNPGLPFFGAGNITGDPDAGEELAILNSASVAMGIAGFGLFVSSILAPPFGTLRATIVLLSTALWLKFMAASFMLQPHFAVEWVSIGRMVGLAMGLVFLVPLRTLSRPTRIYLALLLVLAGALTSKIAGAYSSLDEFLRLFRWPYGQLANFASMTRFLHELWPFAAVVFLIALFLKTRRGVE